MDVTNQPSSAMDALANNEKNIYSNIHALLNILAILPVSIAIA